MDLTRLGGLPAHPLLVHIPVVLVPLTFLGAVAIVVRPAWRERFGFLVAGGAVAALIGVQLAMESGQALEEHVDHGKTLHDHVELASSARPLVAVFTVVVVAYVALAWLRSRRAANAPSQLERLSEVSRSAGASRVLAGLAVLSLVFGAFATAWIVRTGHNGAKATWEKTDLSGGEGGEGGEAGGG
jgi:hypothetical protein